MSLSPPKISRTIISETIGPRPGSEDGVLLSSSLWEMGGVMFVFKLLYSMRKHEEEARPLLSSHWQGSLLGRFAQVWPQQAVKTSIAAEENRHVSLIHPVAD